MTEHVYYGCDGCSRTIKVGEWGSMDWKKVDGLDLCPDCQEADKEE